MSVVLETDIPSRNGCRRHFGGQSPVRLQAAGFAKCMLGSCHPIWKLGAPFQELRSKLHAAAGRKFVVLLHVALEDLVTPLDSSTQSSVRKISSIYNFIPVD